MVYPEYYQQSKGTIDKWDTTYESQNNTPEWKKSDRKKKGTSLEVQQLRPHTSNAGDVVSIPGWGHGSVVPPHPHLPLQKKNTGYIMDDSNYIKF